jgi:thioredoxin reductase (NADPH)
VNGLFYAIGHVPNTEWIKDAKTGKFGVTCDVDGYVVQINKHSSETSVEGVFAAGDVADKKYRQAITAAGSGW